MYCKNCGRHLKEGMRFCDRCGQSVRKSKQSSQAARHQEIEELKAERLNRKKRLAEKEAKQMRNTQRKKKKSNALVFFVVILLVAVVSVIIGYNIFPSNGNISGTTATVAPKSTGASVNATEAPSSVKSGYSVLTIGNISCPYPSDFHANVVNGNEKLNIVDSLGGATMVVRQEGKSGEPKNLMLEYANQGGTASYSRAGADWYAITLENNGTITHRKCILRNGIAVYYDFSYSTSSSSAKRYEEHISYIDSNFK